MTSYCEYVRTQPEDDLNRRYHDTQYGFPLTDEAALFERLVLEINQAGLSWTLILKRAPEFHRAYDGFDVDTVAAYTEAERARLLADAGVIRNRLKVNAAIENARRIQSLRGEFGSFQGWLDAHHPLSLEEWTKLFKRNFVFTGGEIVKEFLMSTGYLPGAHDPECPVYWQIARLQPGLDAGAQENSPDPARERITSIPGVQPGAAGHRPGHPHGDGPGDHCTDRRTVHADALPPFVPRPLADL